MKHATDHEIVQEARRIATENGHPVWIERDRVTLEWTIHETPDGIPADAVIVEPDEARANARLIASAPELLSVLRGCADALREAGRDFARGNPYAARPNLYELHAQAAQAAIDKAEGRT